MARKREYQRRIDNKPRLTGGGSLVEQVVPDVPPAVVGGIPSPTNLVVVSQVTARSTQSAQKYVNLQWDSPDHVIPDYYSVEYDTTGLFTNPEIERATRTTAAILTDVGKTYYFRVNAIVRNVESDYTNTVSVLITADTTVPPDITVASATFNGGNLVINYTEPSGEAYKQARIRIYNADKSVNYGTFYSSGGRFVWSESENITASLTGVTSVAVEINSQSWYGVNGTVMTVTATLSAPNAVTSVTTDFTTGNLIINWTNPNNAPYKCVTIQLYSDNTMSTLYRTFSVVGNSINYTYVDNLKDTNEVGDNSIYYRIVVQSWLNLSSTAITGTATKALPSAPSNINQSWNGDTGVKEADVLITWDAVPYVKEYRVSINGVIYTTTYTKFLYTYNQNVQQNGVGDPTLSIVLYSIDYINKVSTASSTINAVNAAPPITTVTATYGTNFGDYNTFVQLGATTIADFKHIEYTLFSGTVASGTLLTTVTTPSTAYSFSQLAEGQYQIRIAIVDVFDQKSTYIIGTQLYVKAFNLDELRQELDNYNSSDTLLSTVLKDGIKTVSESPVNYITLTNTGWDYILSRRPLIDRYGAVTIAGTNSANMSVVFATSTDNTTWTYWYFNNTFQSGEPLLVSAASLATAQSNTVALAAATNFSYNFVFPITIESRFIRVYFKLASGSLKLTELYPRRLMQADDIRGETIVGSLIAANTITGANIFGTTLSAIKTFTGTLDINQGGYVKAGMTGYNTGSPGYFLGYSGTTPVLAIGNPSGTNMSWNGTTLALVGGNFVIKTQNTGNRIELSANGLSGYDSGNTLQVQIRSSDGVLVWGAGYGQASREGIFVNTTLPSIDALTGWYTIGGVTPDSGTSTRTPVGSYNFYTLDTSSAQVKAGGITQRYFASTVFVGQPTAYYNAIIIDPQDVTFNGQTPMPIILLSATRTYSKSLFVTGFLDVNGSIDVGTLGGTNYFSGTSQFNGSIVANSFITANNDVTATSGTTVAVSKFVVDYVGQNAGNMTYAMRFGTLTSGEGIGSARTSGSFNQNGLDLYTNNILRTYISNAGLLTTLAGLTVSNAALSSTSSSRTILETLQASTGSNVMKLEISLLRHTTASTWQSASVIIQRQVDATYQRFISIGETGIGVNVVNAAYALEVSGDAAKDGGGSWTTRSDRKTKQNIVKVYDGLNKILALPEVVEFEYNGLYGTEYTGNRYIGFIANELEKVDKRLVSERFIPRKEGEIPERILYMNPDAIHYWTINATKELHAMIRNLETEVNRLKVLLANCTE